MKVYIFRHGHAESKALAPGKTDEGRRMVPEGKEQVRWTCERAKEFGLAPSVIMSSPRVRGRETAVMAKDILNPKAEVLAHSCLEPEAKVGETYKALAKLNSGDSVILVTHLPHLGHLIADMLDWESVWQNLDFENGAMARIDFKGPPKPRKGSLVWLISPTRSG